MFSRPSASSSTTTVPEAVQHVRDNIIAGLKSGPIRIANARTVAVDKSTILYAGIGVALHSLPSDWKKYFMLRRLVPEARLICKVRAAFKESPTKWSVIRDCVASARLMTFEICIQEMIDVADILENYESCETIIDTLSCGSFRRKGTTMIRQSLQKPLNTVISTLVAKSFLTKDQTLLLRLAESLVQLRLAVSSRDWTVVDHALPVCIKNLGAVEKIPDLGNSGRLQCVHEELDGIRVVARGFHVITALKFGLEKRTIESLEFAENQAQAMLSSQSDCSFSEQVLAMVKELSREVSALLKDAVQIRGAILRSLKTNDEDEMKRWSQMARRVRYTEVESQVRECEDRLEQINLVKNNLMTSLETLDRQSLVEAVEHYRFMKLPLGWEPFVKASHLAKIPEKKLLQLKIQGTMSSGSVDEKARETMLAKTQYFERADVDMSEFTMSSFPGLKSTKMFGLKQGIFTPEVAEGMLLHSSKRLHTSLTRLKGRPLRSLAVAIFDRLLWLTRDAEDVSESMEQLSLLSPLATSQYRSLVTPNQVPLTPDCIAAPKAPPPEKEKPEEAVVHVRPKSKSRRPRESGWALEKLFLKSTPLTLDDSQPGMKITGETAESVEEDDNSEKECVTPLPLVVAESIGQTVLLKLLRNCQCDFAAIPDDPVLSGGPIGHVRWILLAVGGSDGLANYLQGLLEDRVRDEIYVQLVKQLRHNFDPHSVEKYWKVLWAALHVFPPSCELENYLEVFLRTHGRFTEALQLHAILIAGPVQALPSPDEVEELLAVDSAPPALKDCAEND